MNEKRRLSGIMFTDVVGYSAIMDKNESAAMKLLENHKNITKPIIENYNGEILKPQGDGFMIEFSSVVDAVGLAVGLAVGVYVGSAVGLAVGLCDGVCEGELVELPTSSN